MKWKAVVPACAGLGLVAVLVVPAWRPTPPAVAPAALSPTEDASGAQKPGRARRPGGAAARGRKGDAAEKGDGDAAPAKGAKGAQAGQNGSAGSGGKPTAEASPGTLTSNNPEFGGRGPDGTVIRAITDQELTIKAIESSGREDPFMALVPPDSSTIVPPKEDLGKIERVVLARRTE